MEMNKKEFCEVINFIVDQHNKQEKLQEAMKEMSPDFFVDFYPYSQYEDQLVSILNKLFGQEDSEYPDISYYLYELDYGKDYEKYPIEMPDGRKIFLSSPEILYDFITGVLD